MVQVPIASSPAVDEVGAEHPVVIADERVGAVPLVHAEVGVEVVGQGVPRDQAPAHPRLQALDVRLRGARHERQRGVAGVSGRARGRDPPPRWGTRPRSVVTPALEGSVDQGAPQRDTGRFSVLERSGRRSGRGSTRRCAGSFDVRAAGRASAVMARDDRRCLHRSWVLPFRADESVRQSYLRAARASGARRGPTWPRRDCDPCPHRSRLHPADSASIASRSRTA